MSDHGQRSDGARRCVEPDDDAQVAACVSDRARESVAGRQPRRVRWSPAPHVSDTTPLGPVPGEPLGLYFGARSGDKGGNANVGIWATDAAGYGWLAANLSATRISELVPETAGLEVRRYELPNLFALNFVIVGYLGQGVASSTAFDTQAKGLGEYLRSRIWRSRI